MDQYLTHGGVGLQMLARDHHDGDAHDDGRAGRKPPARAEGLRRGVRFFHSSYFVAFLTVTWSAKYCG